MNTLFEKEFERVRRAIILELHPEHQVVINKLEQVKALCLQQLQQMDTAYTPNKERKRLIERSLRSAVAEDIALATSRLSALKQGDAEYHFKQIYSLLKQLHASLLYSSHSDSWKNYEIRMTMAQAQAFLAKNKIPLRHNYQHINQAPYFLAAVEFIESCNHSHQRLLHTESLLEFSETVFTTGERLLGCTH